MPPARLPLAAALAALALLASPAAAAERFVKAFTGIGLTADSELRVTLPGQGLDLVFDDVVWEDYSLGSPSIPYVGARAGLYFERRPWLGVAIDVFHFKVFARTGRSARARGTVGQQPFDGRVPIGAIVQKYNIGNGVNMVLFEVLGRLRLKRSGEFPDGRLQPYFGVGLGPTVLYTASTVLDESREGYELGRLGVEALAGCDWRIGRRFGAFAELKLTRTEANGSLAAGTSETDLVTRHLVIGAAYFF